MRRILTFVVVASAVALGGLYWLHDGDLAAAGREVATAAGADPLTLSGSTLSGSALSGIPDTRPAKVTVAPDPGYSTEDPPPSP